MATKVKPCRIKATGTPQAGYVPKYVDEDTFQWGTGGGGSDIVYATQAEYNALLPGAESDGKHYFIYTNSTPRLPAEYQEVEYIESSRTQWIDTGIYANQDTVVKTKWNLVQYNYYIQYDKLYGTYGNIGTNCFMFQSNRPDDNKIRVVNYINANTDYCVDSLSALIIGRDYTTIHSNTEFILDGVSQGTCNASTFTTPTTITIFGLHDGNNITQSVYMKLYYFQIYDGSDLVRNFIPCYRKADSVIGLYDLVNDVFYTNSGSGTFTKGSDV